MHFKDLLKAPPLPEVAFSDSRVLRFLLDRGEHF